MTFRNIILSKRSQKGINVNWDPSLAPTKIPLSVSLTGLLHLFSCKTPSILEQFLAVEGLNWNTRNSWNLRHKQSLEMRKHNNAKQSTTYVLTVRQWVADSQRAVCDCDQNHFGRGGARMSYINFPEIDHWKLSLWKFIFPIFSIPKGYFFLSLKKRHPILLTV